MRRKAPASSLGRFVFGLFVYVASAPVFGASGTHHYRVQLAEDLSSLTVKACFYLPVPQQLVSYDDNAIRHLRAVVLHSGRSGTHLQPGKQTIALPEIKPGDCVSYTVDFMGEVAHPWFRNRQSRQQQVLLDIHRWLWIPDPFDADSDSIDITFMLPNGMAVSAPWQLIERAEGMVTYRYNLRPPDWDGRIAIGHFKTLSRTIGQSQIDISILNGRSAVDTDAILHWVNKNLDALMLAYGEFPVPRLQVLVVPVGKDREPVPWGQVLRGGGDAVHVYIDHTRPLADFLDDWVLIHELSHLLHPRLTDNDHWLSEGLASYYQNLLRARAGLLSAHQAWEKLHTGFQRGIRGTPRNRTLAQVSESMSRDHLYMRVYWSGASISLLADYALRSQSHHGLSLDSALGEFHRCCLPTRRLWSGREVMQKLDAITQTNIFTRLYQQHIPSTKFPDLSSLYHDLGLITSGKQISFDTNAPAADIRQAIMSPAK
jgi:hypothetical protein